MSDLLHTGLEWLAEQNRAHRARTVAYVRADATLSVSATVDRTRARVDRGDGVLVYSEARDYIIDAAAISTFGEPEPGDVIRDPIDDAVQEFEVMGPGGEPCFRYTDQRRATYRIHTKHIGEAA